MMHRRGAPALLWALALALFAVALLVPRSAAAYPWMIRHEYTGCTQCHADPSGSGLLTQYGQAQGEVLLATRWGKPADEDVGPGGKFLYGAVTPPDWLLLGGDLRIARIVNNTSTAGTSSRFLFMQGDLRAQVRVGAFRAAGSLGVLEGPQHLSAITTGQDWNLVSREYWLGVDFGEETQVLLRAGRMNLPYGLRSNEHTMWIRQASRTDINESQQVGLSVAVNSERWRAEGMFIAGNYQLSPDAYRERGYSAYAEYAFTPRLAAGLTSLLTYAQQDLYRRTPLLRQAHGAFARYSPVTPLVLMAEVDALVATPDGQGTSAGLASMLQADVEPWQGVHFIGAGELLQEPVPNAGLGYGGWIGAAWFFFPKLDVRVDGIFRDRDVSGTRVSSQTFLVQFHAYL